MLLIDFVLIIVFVNYKNRKTIIRFRFYGPGAGKAKARFYNQGGQVKFHAWLGASKNNGKGPAAHSHI